jgi:protein farnesyltransferase/geranylgeranyltransferase type-1 subunit alpha
MEPGKYSNSPQWADITPIPQSDGPNALATIAYSETYTECMSYLRAVMAANDTTLRVLDLTEDIIAQNPAHYTVWLYRARVLFGNNVDLEGELRWLGPVALRFQKNYQIWQHREMVVEKLAEQKGDGAVDLDAERTFIGEMMELDAKNYHVWSYRQWLVRRFGLWDDREELEEVERLLRSDVRNNSAWNHRWYVRFGRDGGEVRFWDRDGVQEELRYAMEKVRLAPQNQSPWNYIRGLQRKATGPAAISLSSLRAFAEEFASVEDPEKVRSSHALDLLSDIFAEQGKTDDASRGLELLATKYDPIRSNYWNWRKSQLDGKAEADVQASA